MGPIRCLYEQEGDLETALLQQTPVVLRPVQMSDCGERHVHFSERMHACSYLAGTRRKPGGGEYRRTKTHVCFVRAFIQQMRRTRPSWEAR